MDTALRILAPLQYDSAMDRSLSEFGFTDQLLPSLEKGCVIVMDNASFHCKTRLFSVAHEARIVLIFLPPYSPELNPIEHFWAWLKRQLRKNLPFLPIFLEESLKSELKSARAQLKNVDISQKILGAQD